MQDLELAAVLGPTSASTKWPVFLWPVRLETRRIEDDICIRVFPDEPFVDAHQPELTHEEHAAGLPLHEFLGAHPGFREDPTPDPSALEEARALWLELARRHGAARAAWIIESLSRDANAPTVDTGTLRPPALFLLPDRFLFVLYKDGQFAYGKRGNGIRSGLTLLPAERGVAQEAPPRDALFDAASKWVYDFREAVEVGLGVRIPLKGPDRTAAKVVFSDIVAFGLRSGEASDGVNAFKQLIESHRYSDGVEFLRYSTPTNSTGEVASGHSETEEKLLEAFEHEIRSPLTVLSSRRLEECAARLLTNAVGLAGDTSSVAHLKGAELVENAEFPAMLEALWPATGDYMLSHMLDTKLGPERSQLLIHLRENLRPRGHMAALRVGNVPYGIIPASRVRRYSTADASGWKSDSHDHPPQSRFPWASFDDAMLKALHVLFPRWLDRAEDPSVVPRAGASADPDEELIRILGMAPHSLDFRVRPIVDHTMIRVLLMLFGPRLFGIDSGFGGWADEQMSVSRWVQAKETITDKAETLLGCMGLTNQRGSALLRSFYWGDGEALYMPLVRDPAIASDGPEAYLPKLVADGGNAPENFSKTLLYDILRRSLRLGIQFTSLPPTAASIQVLNDRPVLDFFGNHVTVEAVKALAARAPALTLPDDAQLATIVAQINVLASPTVASVEAQFSGSPGLFASFASRLRQDATPRFQSAMSDVFDVLTCRLDAYFFANHARRLRRMHQERARDQEPMGVHWGAWGYLEKGEFMRAPTPRGKPAIGGGFILAPSATHATAAAMLKSGYDSHRREESRKAYSTDISSARMRRAEHLIDGVQQGQPIEVLLGAQVERDMHFYGLDRAIDPMRREYPGETHPDEELDADENPEPAPARSITDGRALVTSYTLPTPFSDRPAMNGMMAGLTTTEQANFRVVLDDLADTLDAVGDALLFESVFQAVQGNYDRSGAAMDACAGTGRPPELESLATPISGATLRHKVCLLLPSSVPSDLIESGARAQIEPRFNAFVRTILGASSSIGCRAYVTSTDPPYAGTLDVTLDQLTPPISALDFVYLCGATPDGSGATEIEVRLRRVVRADASTPEGAAIRLALDEAPPSVIGARPVTDAMEVGRAVLEMIGNATPMTPVVLTHPDEFPSGRIHSDAEVQALRARASEAISLMEDQKDALAVNDDGTVDDLHATSGFGIDDALFETGDAAAIEDHRARTLEIVTTRLNAANAALLAGAADADASVTSLLGVFSAVFGESFVTLPVLDLSAPERKATSIRDGATMATQPATERVWMWMQQMAEAHPRIRALESLLMAAESWSDIRNNALVSGPHVIQVPPRPAFGWQALSDAELGTNVRAKGAQSIVAFAPSDFSLTTACGFVVHESTEDLGAKTGSPAVGFEYDQPAQQAPCAALIGVPGNLDLPLWTGQSIAELIRDTIDLAKVRMVDLDALPLAAGIVPALLFPISETLPQVQLIQPMVHPQFIMPPEFKKFEESTSATTELADVV